MSITKDIIGSLAPVLAIGALGYLVAKKFGLLGGGEVSTSKTVIQHAATDLLHPTDVKVLGGMAAVDDAHTDVTGWLSPASAAVANVVPGSTAGFIGGAMIGNRIRDWLSPSTMPRAQAVRTTPEGTGLFHTLGQLGGSAPPWEVAAQGTIATPGGVAQVAVGRTNGSTMKTEEKKYRDGKGGYTSRPGQPD